MAGSAGRGLLRLRAWGRPDAARNPVHGGPRLCVRPQCLLTGRHSRIKFKSRTPSNCRAIVVPIN
jgi:hypothetical protein